MDELMPINFVCVFRVYSHGTYTVLQTGTFLEKYKNVGKYRRLDLVLVCVQVLYYYSVNFTNVEASLNTPGWLI